MNSKLKGLLSGAVVSALVIGSVAFAEEGATAPANADQKMTGDKNGCSGKNGCEGHAEHHKKHGKKHAKHAEKKADTAPASTEEKKAE